MSSKIYIVFLIIQNVGKQVFNSTTVGLIIGVFRTY